MKTNSGGDFAAVIPSCTTPKRRRRPRREAVISIVRPTCRDQAVGFRSSALEGLRPYVKEMKITDLRELEEMAVKLEAARKLPHAARS